MSVAYDGARDEHDHCLTAKKNSKNYFALFANFAEFVKS
jgi:hypothetical protein